MLDLNTFIPDEMTVAAEHPLVKNLERSLPDANIVSPAEIWAIQQRDRIPGIVRKLVPLNALTTWEYWWCVPGRMLLPEDVEVLRCDRPRINTILSKLVWLLGGHCFGDDAQFDRDSNPVYDWQQVLDFVNRTGLKPEVLDIDFTPTAIAQVTLPNADGTEPAATPNYAAVTPGHWHIEFFQLQPIESGFILQEPKPLCSCQIWTGKPFIKHLETGEIQTRYDLSLSSPFDMTTPPWLASTSSLELIQSS